jgi:tRNA A37 methylthiotransferase MiaB
VARLRQRIDRPAITTDIMVGFPGETEEDFAATLDAAWRARFSRIHIFPFSPRPGTPAYAWRGQVPPPQVVKQRCRRLAELERQLGADYRRRFIGQTVEVLVEEPNRRMPAGHARGLTDRYLEVTFPEDVDTPSVAGSVARVRITRPAEAGLAGEPVR